MNEADLAKQILDDLRNKIHPKVKEFKPIPERLKKFVEDHVPEAEVVKIGRKDILRLKEEKK